MGITAIMLPALATGLAAAREGRAQGEERLGASALLSEASEATRSVREKGWVNIASNGTYHPVISGNSWSLAGGGEVIGNFTRQIVISDANRNSSGDLVTSGGIIDPSTKKVDISVSWSSPIPSTINQTQYFSRHLGNTTWVQTTQASFSGGTATNTTVTNTSGGEVQLSSVPGSINWASPSVAGIYNSSGSTDAQDVFVAGNYAYLAVGSLFYIVNISNPTSPVLSGSYSASGNINSIYVAGNYAYLASGANSAELTIVNITIPAAPVLAASLDLGANDDGLAIFVAGNYAYVGKVAAGGGNREFYIVNISNPLIPSLTGSFEVGSNVNSVFVSGNYAYLATTENSAELRVVNVTNPASPAAAATYDASSNSDGLDISVSGTTAYLGTQNNASGSEFYVISFSAPSTTSLLGSYNVGNNVNGVYLTSTTAFLATSLASKQFLVLNVASPASITETSSLNLTSASNDIVQIGNYAYLASIEDSRELIIAGGTVGAGGYQTSGIFESSTFDAGASAGLNYLNFNVSQPAGTILQFQTAVNNDNATWNYVGPDGTSGTFYTSASAFPFALSTGRYVRYKAIFTSDGSSTPILNDITANYSP